jgi:hypothetical protein
MHLLQGLLPIFHPGEFYGMNDEFTRKIACEDEDTRKRRVSLKQQRESILDSLRACNDLPFRSDISVVSISKHIFKGHI